MANPNICDKCFTKKYPGQVKPSIEHADTATCGVCGEFNDVWDFELLEYYKQRGLKLEDNGVWAKLPRLRSYAHGNTLTIRELQSIVDHCK